MEMNSGNYYELTSCSKSSTNLNVWASKEILLNLFSGSFLVKEFKVAENLGAALRLQEQHRRLLYAGPEVLSNTPTCSYHIGLWEYHTKDLLVLYFLSQCLVFQCWYLSFWFIPINKFSVWCKEGTACWWNKPCWHGTSSLNVIIIYCYIQLEASKKNSQ